MKKTNHSLDNSATTTDSVSQLHPLTDKQARFVSEYLVDYNRTQAAIRAGYSRRTARYAGAHLYKNPRVLGEIERRKQLLSERMELTEDEILNEQQAIARANMADYIDYKDGKLNVKKITPQLGCCLKRFVVTDTQFGQRITIELYDKLAALEFLAKTLGMLDKDRRKNEAPFKVLVMEKYIHQKVADPAAPRNGEGTPAS
jgi:phage terminase small subunit